MASLIGSNSHSTNLWGSPTEVDRLMPPFRIALVGFGAMGQELTRQLSSDSLIEIVQIVVPKAFMAEATAKAIALCPHAQVSEALDLSGGNRPSLLVECAGHSALREHVLPALEGGVPCIVASVGALCDPEMAFNLEQAARAGGSRIRLISGALGALDALAAASVGQIDRVLYTGRKPPMSWTDTPVESLHDLRNIKAPTVIFEGHARDAARLFPKNSNVAASIALAGVGFESTRVKLLADPTISHNVHSLMVLGSFGEFQIELKNLPLAANPKTSALTVNSLIRTIRDTCSLISF